MAYAIRRKESVDAEVRRVLTEQNGRARAHLLAWREDTRGNVHQARQAFKRIRALLRLIRPGAQYVYRVENQFFRDVGRNLAFVRDTDAVIDALSLLEVRISGPLAQESLRMLRVGLQQRAARERDCGIHDLPGRIQSACDALAGAERRIRDVPLDELRVRHLRRGAANTLERCADAYGRAARRGSAEDFHAWRKEVKYAYHQAHLMQHVTPRWAEAKAPALGELADVLGHYHDLVILDLLLRTQADELNVDVHLRSMRNTVRSARAEFADAALTLGRGMFGAGSAVAREPGEIKIGA